MLNKRVVPFLLLLSVILLLAPAAVWAAGGEAGGHGHEAAKPALLHWDIGTAFWSIIVFMLLLVILRTAAWKPILTGLQSREQFIRESLDDAKHERDEAKKILAEYTEKVHHASEEATAIVEEGRRDAEEVRKKVQAEARKEADAILERARKEIGIARDDAVKRLHDETILLATNVAGRMIRRDLAPGDHKALVDEALEDMGKLN